jgi:hypothetical protein
MSNITTSLEDIFETIGNFILDNVPTDGWQEVDLHLEVEGNRVGLLGFLNGNTPFKVPGNLEVAKAALQLYDITSQQGHWKKAIFTMKADRSFSIKFSLEPLT